MASAGATSRSKSSPVLASKTETEMRFVSGCQCSATSRPSLERESSSRVRLLAMSASWGVCITAAASHCAGARGMRGTGVFGVANRRRRVRKIEPRNGEGRREEAAFVRREGEWPYAAGGNGSGRRGRRESLSCSTFMAAASLFARRSGMGCAGVLPVRLTAPDFKAVAGAQERQNGEHAPVVLVGRRQAQLREDARHVLLDRAERDHELLGDRLVRLPFRHQPEHFTLARRQVLEWIVAPPAPDELRHDRRIERRSAVSYTPHRARAR